MDLGLIIAVVGIVVVVGVLLVGIVFVIALAWHLRRDRPVDEPVAFNAEHHAADVAETEVFSREALFAFYDSDEHDPTFEGRLDGGILIDGRTDPAIGAVEDGRVVARKARKK